MLLGSNYTDHLWHTSHIFRTFWRLFLSLCGFELIEFNVVWKEANLASGRRFWPKSVHFRPAEESPASRRRSGKERRMKTLNQSLSRLDGISQWASTACNLLVLLVCLNHGWLIFSSNVEATWIFFCKKSKEAICHIWWHLAEWKP